LRRGPAGGGLDHRLNGSNRYGGSTIRLSACSFKSTTNRLPSAATATPLGQPNPAASPGPSTVPPRLPPATVSTTPPFKARTRADAPSSRTICPSARTATATVSATPADQAGPSVQPADPKAPAIA